MKFLGVLGVLCGLVLPVSALDREAFSFTKYELEVRVETDQQRLGVRGKITLRNDSAVAQKNAVLQISSSLSWRSIQSAGKPLEFVSQPYVSDMDHTGSLSEAIVALPQGVPPKGSIELSIGYEGTLPLDATRLTRIGVPEDTAQHAEWDEIGKDSTAVRGAGYVAWYPVAMESANLSEGNSVFETLGRWQAREAHSGAVVDLCPVPGRPVIVANGKVSGGDSKDGCRQYNFPNIGLISPAFAIAAYTIFSHDKVGIAYLGGHRPAAENYALATDLVRPFVSDWFGPLRRTATVADLADAKATPYESGSFLFSPLNPNTDSRIVQLVAVHQLTHQAFESARPWIYEGLAHFAQAVFREQQNGRQAALDYMSIHRAAIAQAEKQTSADSKDASADRSLINTNIEEFYRGKAMYVWWMLRGMVGDAALKGAIAAYRADQDKEPSHMQRLIEAQSKSDLEWFFDDWVYRDRGLPDFRVESAYPRRMLPNGYMLTITVENLGDAGAEVPITLRFQGGEVRGRLDVRGKAKGVIRMEAPSTPLEVVVNDGSIPESDMGNNALQIPAGVD